jgi:hypothetical protein
MVFASFIFFHVEENEPKEDARVPLYPARRQCGRSARKLALLPAGLKQSARIVPPALSMLGAGQRDEKRQIVFLILFRNTYFQMRTLFETN